MQEKQQNNLFEIECAIQPAQCSGNKVDFDIKSNIIKSHPVFFKYKYSRLVQNLEGQLYFEFFL